VPSVRTKMKTEKLWAFIIH